MSFVPKWVDAFLSLDVALVATLILADFLIGKKGRAAMREKVGDWGLKLQQVNFLGFESAHAGKIRSWLERFFGNRWFRLKFFLRTALLSIGITFCAVFLFNILLIDKRSFGRSDELFGFTLFLDVYLPNLLADWFSLAITIFVLKKMQESVHTIRLMLLMVVDLAAVIVLSFAALMGSLGLARFLGLQPPIHIIAGAALVIILWIITLTSVLPSLAHLFVALVFCLSKLLRPVLQKPVELVLLRFYESEKGLLTLLAVGLGALSKIIQASVKYFGGT